MNALHKLLEAATLSIGKGDLRFTVEELREMGILESDPLDDATEGDSPEGGDLPGEDIPEEPDPMMAGPADEGDDLGGELDDGGELPADENPDPMAGGVGGMDELIKALNDIYTPVLIMQELETNIQQTVEEAVRQACPDNVLLERNVIKFDDDARMSQLVALCALLIARQKQSPDYTGYKRASQLRRELKLKIQRDENAAAMALANRYLQQVASTGANSTVKRAAENLNREMRSTTTLS